MRMSCNGCRVLRKGCSENCSIRPCLQWIKSPDSQANATVFLAKFYGRAGLMNLINAGPDHLRPVVFRSLLYEACGRIVNPICGSVGLVWGGTWHICEAAVEAVLQGSPITPVASETAANSQMPPLKFCDIRHVSKDDVFADPHRVRTRYRMKRSVDKPKPGGVPPSDFESSRVTALKREGCSPDELNRSTSHDSSVTHPSDTPETESMISAETAEASLLSRAEPESLPEPSSRGEDGEVELELTLGMEPIKPRPIKKRKIEITDPTDDDTCHVQLGLH
ncbi:LOB domain-containing protein 40 [Malania oleifera]|uniref:LOB domain-containing protein 40 n=1 Tax=Malania oleifera TaxID=397392 RepID=UPI0025ADE251|nr:LOB domain-containing protein 40 [Malania oleifera]